MAAVEECSKCLEEKEVWLKKGVQKAEVANFDETSVRVKGKNAWVHVSSTGRMTHYGVSEKRGAEGMCEVGLLPEFQGIAVHDHWKAYMNYASEHAFCNAHHLRELTYVEEEMGQEWAGEMKGLLLEIKEYSEKKFAGELREEREDLRDLRERIYRMRYDQIIGNGLKKNPQEERSEGRVRAKQTKARNLLERLRSCKTGVLAFMDNALVPFDNNQAERDLRMLKVQQKTTSFWKPSPKLV